jgi:ketosteroid isomerase-like protein
MLDQWIAAYERAWSSNDPDEIGALFADDAVYYTAPFREPWRGRAEIVAGWLERKDAPGGWSFSWQALVDEPDVSIITGTTTYLDPPQGYSNLWVIRLDPEGRCSEFTEWWMEHTASG